MQAHNSQRFSDVSEMTLIKSNIWALKARRISQLYLEQEQVQRWWLQFVAHVRALLLEVVPSSLVTLVH